MQRRLAFAISSLALCLCLAATVAAGDETVENRAADNQVAYQGAQEPTTAAEIYGQGVRETDWRSPAEQLAGFHLPSGFAVNLFASEPMIAKPLNMAWDHAGRLWVTSTVEYPYPAKDPAEARDQILILEDVNRDGQADKVTTFAEGLNIPMGLLPMHDGVIAFNIPNIVYLRDTDGDDRVDQVETLLGPFDTTRDTHGMINSLRLGGDGWIYACHGFNNQSRVTDRSGNTIEMHSGNTFRFTPDGLHAQVYSRGQVNPFGMTRDEWGNWYSADCHSKPITALLRGGCYPSFGRPHDGLGFAPSMMDHLHGSTAISGLCYYQADHFPPAYRDRFYSGNVMTSRLNCNALHRTGATAKAQEQPDFLTSDDPWFRPVDIQLGPDGGLYVADFYNKIIGHYEVPLTHEGRDRTSGRIWRITYSNQTALHEPSSGTISSKLLIEQLGSPNVTLRQMASVQLAQRCQHSEESATLLAQLARDQNSTADARIACLEALAVAGKLSTSLGAQLISDANPIVAGRSLRILANLPAAKQMQWTAAVIAGAADQMQHSEPQVALAAIEFLGAYGNQVADSDHSVILKLLWTIGNFSDPTMVQAARIATRDLLRDERWLQLMHRRLFESSDDQIDLRELRRVYLEVLPALDSEFASSNLLSFAASLNGDSGEYAKGLMKSALELAEQFPASVDMANWSRVVNNFCAGDLSVATNRLSGLAASLGASGKRWDVEQTEAIANFRDALLLDATNALMEEISSSGAQLSWRASGSSSLPLGTQERKRTDGEAVQLWSSFPLGENHVGAWRSEPLTCPDELTFWLAGHNGPPSEPDSGKSFVRLLDASGIEIARTTPPRNDAAHEIRWELHAHAEAWVRLEIVDGDNGGAYAWLAVGGFSEAALNPSEQDRMLADIQRLVEMSLGRRIAPHLRQTLRESIAGRLSPMQQTALTSSLLMHDSQPLAAQLVRFAATANLPGLVPDEWLAGETVTAESVSLLTERLARSADSLSQRKLSAELLKSVAGCQLLAGLVQRGIVGAVALGPKPEIFPSGLTDREKQVLDNAFSVVAGAEESRKAVQERFDRLDWSEADFSRGQKVFAARCVSCHQLGGKGALVGPQLDGAIKRTRKRLAEDILAPNLNVDVAFRTTSLLLNDDSVLSGLITNETATALSIIKPDGKPATVLTERIAQRKQSNLSLMPSGLAEQISDSELADLLHFLTTFVH